MLRSSSHRSNSMPFAFVLTAFAGLAAAGCDSTPVMADGGVTTPGALGCSDPEPGVLDLIDDMEDGDALLLYRGGRSSVWYTYHDQTSGSLTPDEGMTVTMEPIPGGRCGISKQALRVIGSGFTYWGAMVTSIPAAPNREVYVDLPAVC